LTDVEHTFDAASVEWRRYWKVTFRWEQGRDGVRSRGAHTVADLRRLLAWGRQHPHITYVRYESVRELAGEPPTHCRNDHSYAGGSHTRARMDSAECVCGGHLLYICRWEGCGDVRLEPVPTLDCDIPQGDQLNWYLSTRHSGSKGT
jgi:hypothetical protein